MFCVIVIKALKGNGDLAKRKIGESMQRQKRGVFHSIVEVTILRRKL